MSTAGQERSKAIDEVAGLARLAGALVGALTVPVQQTHQGVSKRVFDSIGPVAEPVRVMHDSISAVAYGGTKFGAHVAGQAVGLGLGLTRGSDNRRSVSGSRLGQQGLAFSSGLFGDWMVGKCDDLIVQTYFTHHGQPLIVEDISVTNRLVVFVHGLAETTSSWSWWSTDDDGERIPTYAERLEDVGWTPVEIGWNTGKSVDEAGYDINQAISQLVASWPTAITDIALVGHSMGGIALSAACEAALHSGDDWVQHVSHVATLGTPFGGSWLAKLAHNGAAAAMGLPETTGLATFLNLRSAGIRDLTQGWGESQSLIERLPNAQFGFFSASLRSPLSWVIGDGLVSRASATPIILSSESYMDDDGMPKSQYRTGHDRVTVRHYSSVGHVRLVNHPDVAHDLEDLLDVVTTNGHRLTGE